MKKMLLLVMLSLAVPAVAQDKMAADSKLQTALFAQEKALWEAWIKKDIKVFEEWLAPNGVFVDPMGIVDRAGSLKMIASHNCKINSYSFSDQKLTRVSKDVAIISYKATQEGTCEGQKVPTTAYATSTWVKQKGKWWAVSHQETPGMP